MDSVVNNRFFTLAELLQYRASDISGAAERIAFTFLDAPELAAVADRSALEGVREAVVLAREDVPGDRRLVAYVVPQAEDQAIDQARLRAGLMVALPEYMVPGHYVVLAQLPLTPNGKVDRKALPAPEYQRDELGYVAPRTQTEAALTAIWAEVLKLDRVGGHDNFFELGGHSLLAVALISQINREFDINLPVSRLFFEPTIAALSQHLGTEDPYRQLIIPLKTGGKQPPIFLIHPAGGHVFCYADLTRALDDSYPVYGIQSAAAANLTITPYDLDTVCETYISAMLDVQETGPFHLGGWSLGGTLAFQIARKLEQRGHIVQWVALFDTVPAAKEISPVMALDEYITLLSGHSDEELAFATSVERALHRKTMSLVSGVGVHRFPVGRVKFPHLWPGQTTPGRTTGL